ncbi:MAG: HlyU family transcriptional regulator [Alphaproteobacteria bacterium]
MGSKFTDFWRRLMAPEQKEATDQESERALTYKGYAIRPTPRRQGSQWLTAGVITKEFADGVKEHHFIRAETHATKDAAAAFSIVKAKQIIDEKGDRLLEDR